MHQSPSIVGVVNLESAGAVLIGLSAVFGVVWKVLIDKDMAISEGVPIAGFVAIWSYLQVRIAIGSGAHLQGAALLIGVMALFSIGQFYRRNPPKRRKGHVKIESERARNGN